MNRLLRLRHAARLSWLAAVCATLASATAGAQVCTGVGYYEACLDAVGGRPMGSPMPRDPSRIIDDIFRTTDSPPRFAPQLTFGRVMLAQSAFNYPCATFRNTDPRQYTANVCDMLPTTSVPMYSDALDWRFTVTARLRRDGTPAGDLDACGGDRGVCGYETPWLSAIVMDLQGAANRVVVFPITDHVTDSCLEAFEYSVYLTDNPASREFAGFGGRPDATRWNAAILVRGYTRGWTNNAQSTGTVADMAVHPLNMAPGGEAVADSIATVWALPCGVTFRYAAIVPGNWGNPDGRCAFHSNEYEWDAVAGLNEDGSAICPDADGDGFRDARCGGNDCDDADRAVNPGATEDCRSTRDVNCDMRVPMCPTSTACVNGICVPACIEGACATGFNCQTVPMTGEFCVPSACAGASCPAGQVCGPRGCQAPCDGAMCPPGQTCIGGACVDACAGVMCGTNQHCEDGRCVPSCACLGCATGRECNMTSGRCEATGCGVLPCAAADRDCRGATPRCRMSFCDGVMCPLGQRCNETARRCEPDLCFGIACPSGLMCEDGRCVATPPDVMPSDGSTQDGSPSDDGGAGDANLDATADGRADGGVRRDGGTTGDPSGCACRTAGRTPRPNGAFVTWVLTALGLMAYRRRARRRPAP